MKNISQSYRAKLLNKSRIEGESFQRLSLLYMQEGFLNRLSKSKYKKSLILKGGLYLYAISNFKGRSTKDIDFLGMNISNNNKAILNIIKEIVLIDCNDGLLFDTKNINVENIIANKKYEGNRIQLKCYLDTVKNNIQIDIGFGDIIYPKVQSIKYPTLLQNNIINLNTYSVESVIAEKAESIISKAEINSRMKDYYDIYTLFNNTNIDKDKLKSAINNTFNNRKTNIDIDHNFLNDNFWENTNLNTLWKGFLKRIDSPEIKLRNVKEKLWSNLNQILYEYIKNKNIENNKMLDKKDENINKDKGRGR